MESDDGVGQSTVLFIHITLEEHALPPVDLPITWKRKKERNCFSYGAPEVLEGVEIISYQLYRVIFTINHLQIRYTGLSN